MSGPRPLHLSRRGAVYVIRLTMPKDLQELTGVIDIRRSLQTKTIDVARGRCLDAEKWFNTLIRQLRAMSDPTREDIEIAAARFFALLQEQVDQPRAWPADHFDYELAMNIEETRNRIANLEDQLRVNSFDGKVEHNASELLAPLSCSLDVLDRGLAMLVRQLAAKAEHQQMRYFEHVLTSPAHPFTLDDPVFAKRASVDTPISLHRGARRPVFLETLPLEDRSLQTLIDRRIASMESEGQGLSNINETKRIYRWVMEEFGADTDIATITTSELRKLRDKFQTIDKTKRSRVKDGLKSLNDYQTTVRADQIRSETARRYWSYVKELFKMAIDGGDLEHDPAASLSVKLRKDEEAQSPEPYSKEELERYFSLPLFTGCESRARQKKPGNHHVRGGHFWSGLLQAYTGMRAGELSQLLPEDFVFASDQPHLLVRRENAEGEKVKTAKTKASVRAIPIADDLLTLGLRQFVEGRTKKSPNSRVFAEFPLGTGGKVSDGLSKFWGRYIRAFGLHKPGRATHVWRHTVIYHLRKRGVNIEDIGYLVGHKGQSETATYGAGELLERVRTNSLERLDYGIDVVKLVGGPYNPKIHAE